VTLRALAAAAAMILIMPVLADAYGLYYNVDMLKKAGITSPPKTISELTADAKKLTQRNPDGSLKVVGFNPTFGWYEMVHAHAAPSFGAKWTDASGVVYVGQTAPSEGIVYTMIRALD